MKREEETLGFSLSRKAKSEKLKKKKKKKIFYEVYRIIVEWEMNINE